MPERRPPLARADLPGEFTAETVRRLPLSTLRRLADHRNAILTEDEQRAFDQAIHEVMRGTADRVSRRLTSADWSAVRRGEDGPGVRAGRPANRTDEQLRRLARRIGQQVDVAEMLAPGVDWSFASSGPTTDVRPVPPEISGPAARPGGAEQADPGPDTDTDSDTDTDTDGDSDGTVSDLEQRITEQVELVEVMSDIAEMSRRTYALEQQRDLQTTRGVFFGFVVSVAVLVGGWAPLVAAPDWGQRFWVIGLALGTCLVAGLVYALVRRSQRKSAATDEATGETT